ncbi:MAG: flagellar biosynthetic protein FliR [Deltaproteobacteria bacterium]|nr:flagellar biosynthetic protein FliR [Deltaproteobacteria bacterium]
MLEAVFSRYDTFIFVFIRTMSVVAAIPFFSGRTVPLQVRMGLALSLAVFFIPVVGVTATLPSDPASLALGIAREALIGISLGMTVKFVFAGVELAGQLAGMQMGFALANVLDPQTNSQLSVVSQFTNILAIFLFFSLDMHLMFIAALKESFDFIPPYGFLVTEKVVDGLFSMSSGIFSLALKLAAPVVVAVFLANIAMGVLARTVPQLNVFVVGFPITITLGLFIMIFSMPFIVSTISQVFVGLSYDMVNMVRISR